MDTSTKRGGVVITDARSGASRELARRQKRYALTMAFRTACFIAMVFVPGVFRWVLAAGAVFLPYIAVIAANQADNRWQTNRGTAPVVRDEVPQITTGHYETTPDDDDEQSPKPTDGNDQDRAA